jgi:hypothetical protein
MTSAQELAKRVEEVFLNGKWIANTNFKEQLLQIDSETATHKVKNLNTITDLTFHINYYISGLIEFFKTGELTINDKFSFNCPTIRTEADWQELVFKFISDSEKIINIIQNFEDEQLEKIFVKKIYGTYQRNIEALLEHAYYHLRQLVIIRKMIAN